MCGIAGIFHYGNLERSINTSLLREMTSTLFHRGPDGDGFFDNGPIGLGHRRLSIVDLKTGDQPMTDPITGNTIVFNGEIYNYVELKKELQQLGHSFRTTSDTEVLLVGYRHWGTRLLDKLNGMWAFALWSPKNKHLWLSRDRLGEKPLHYIDDGSSFIFASEIKALLPYAPSQKINIEILEIYLTFGFIPAPFTIYKNIQKMPPAHHMLIHPSGVQTVRYWDIPQIPEHDMRSDQKNVEKEFQELLFDSTRLRMRTDVPIGAFLSGGLDSSSVVRIMSDVNGTPINTFTAGFTQRSYDERALAKLVATHCNTNHHERLFASSSLRESLMKTCVMFDEPFADYASIPCDGISQIASRHVKVVLTGDGGDEVMSGYNAYQAEKIVHYLQHTPCLVQMNAARLARLTGYCSGPAQRYSNLISTLFTPFEERVLKKASLAPATYVQNLLLPIQSDLYHADDFLYETMKRCVFQTSFYRMMFYNLSFTLPENMLTKVDRTSMANSIETRLPFLDHRIVEFLCQVRLDTKMKGLERKSLLRTVMKPHLPKQLFKAKKRGFSVPLQHWFDWKNSFQAYRHLPYVEEIGMSSGAIKTYLNLYHRDHQGNRFIWSLFLLNEWLKQYASK